MRILKNKTKQNKTKQNKTKQNKTKAFFYLILLIFLGFSCQKTLEPLNESLESQSEQKSKEAAKTAANKSLRSRNGYLEFRTQMALDSTLKALKTLSPKQRKQWEKALDFTSLRSIFEKGLEEEEKHFNRLAEEGRTPAANEHSDFVNRHQKAFVFEDNGSLLMNIFISDFSHIVNEEGIVRIAGHLFQYTEKYLKILEGGDEKKLGLLKTTIQDDADNFIKVFKVNKAKKSIQKGRYAHRTEPFYKPCNNRYDISANRWVNSRGVVNMFWAESPIYDYNNPYEVCVEDGFGIPYCYYVYPVIGYQPLSVIDVSLKSDVFDCFIFCGWAAWRTYWKNIEATYYVNGSPQYWQKTHSNIAYVFETVYYGPRADLYGDFLFETAENSYTIYRCNVVMN